MIASRSITRDPIQQRVQEKEYKKHQERIQSIIANRGHPHLDNTYDMAN